MAVNLWGLDAIKTKGESVAIVLHMVGARPVREGMSVHSQDYAHLPVVSIHKAAHCMALQVPGVWHASNSSRCKSLDGHVL